MVVSDMGDILSPKKAPQIHAPAVTGAGMPRLFPMPIIATPAVPTEPREVPLSSDMIEHKIIAVTRKNLGLMNLIP